MPLSGYEPERATVRFGKGHEQTFQVRGLSLQDLSEVLRTHMPAVVLLFDAFQEGWTQQQLISAALRDSPLLCAHLVALATDEVGDSFSAALKLPFPIQIEALENIVKLTFEPIGGPGNAFAALGVYLKSLASQDRSPSVAGSPSLAIS